MRTSLLILFVSSLSLPVAADAQGMAGIMAGIRNGGGWVEVPILQGKANISTMTFPTAGLTLAGCVNVWAGHSGEWEIEARDRVTDRVLEITAHPGVGVPFSHNFGMQAQVDFDFQWSEPRDTTLMMWVGLGFGETAAEEACVPQYAGG